MSWEIGFMQGRLSPQVNGMIQAFPKEFWRDEFTVASKNGFYLIEWTLDHEGLAENPLIDPAQRPEVKRIAEGSGVRIGSLTGDCFMQAPFYKFSGRPRGLLIDELKRVIDSCAD